MTLTNLKQLVCENILCLMIVGTYKVHINEINLQVLFNNWGKKKLGTKNIWIYEKSYKDFVINFTIYVNNELIKIPRLYYEE